MNQYMNTAVELAEMVSGQTGENPPVGAVIVKEGRIIGMGAHLKAGGSHAEVKALNDCDESPEGADIFISLEPCNHHGRTPPCVDALIKAGIKNVYYAFKDTTLDGRSGEKLNHSGIGYHYMPHPGTADLYRPFLITKNKKRPFVTLKCAVSLDGKLAADDGYSGFVSNDLSRQDVHQVRHRHDGILIGGGTLLNDDPALTVRQDSGRQPVPVVLAGNRELCADMALFNHPVRPVIFTTNEKNLKFSSTCQIHTGSFSNAEILEHLFEAGVSSLLIEGGTRILTQFLKEELFDDLIIYIAPKIFGYSSYQIYNEKIHDMDSLKLMLHDVEKLDSDIKLTYRRTALCLQD